MPTYNKPETITARSAGASQSAHPLRVVHAQFRDWLFDSALPFWATTGCDGTAQTPAFLGAQECLTVTGVSAHAAFKRVRVQARQLFVFSWAALRGWPTGRSRADGIYAFLLKAHEGSGRWSRSLTPDGKMLDTTADLYDLAFVVFALAWYGRLDASGQAVCLARETVQWVQANMAATGGGFYNTLPQQAEPRQQNPHMHLLEAVLALYDTTQDQADLVLAHDLYQLFSTQFQDAQTGTLGEFFTQNWQPSEGDQGNWLEPGHHFEWVWLLKDYTRLSGVDTSAQANRLYDFALRYGVNQQTALVYDAVGRDGSLLKASSRLWVQGEAVRGVLTQNPRDTDGLAARMATNLLTRYFAGCPAGTWLDQLDEAGEPKVDKIPTSSLYHITTAYDALDKAVNSLPHEDLLEPTT
ncbi:mannose-6-phosphate isomerase [Acetobacter indonesiensis NRIC 0313]|uniref:Mannose-6-phosphate isomerase n=1 Tax=Acetobacter indonesiensis TaxID=104101 RepID=A0A6N3SZ76_9PROT|nr:AGE family epimerase/isomerase [Acetobacter indonesiensis]GAN62243.1 mannose-6-phosphate isomerase [Acetobacter indonesiensis]GBQ60479.1 mannose-6-phosphate isomerase [Acetobacter indonesiensis NRIC 0313]GEN02211.1 hypothetical protein AIN02nite_02360 [Acetobacter indonesiensis]